DDGDACTLADHCVNGACVYDALASCDDNNPCTDDSCDPLQGCGSAINEAPCDDGDACTVADHCVDGACVHDTLTSCDDSNPCTDDSCDPLQGCGSAMNEAPCDDGDACTAGDTCAAGKCGVGLPLDCDDLDPCTTQTCDVVAGCQYQNICAGWSTVAIVSAGFNGKSIGSGTLTLTVGQPIVGWFPGDENSIHIGICPISAVE
ncbi:MAG: hypothetical protein ACI9WU_001364, partial [Myxococcota bacterium]